MSNHLTNKEIDYFVSGLASDKDVKTAEEHLGSCPQCRMAVDTLSSVIAKQPTDSIPGEHVRDAVIAEWYRLHNEIIEKSVVTAETRPGIKKLMTGVAVAASVVIAVSSYIFFSTLKVDDSYPLVITSVAGEVYINDLSTAVNNTLKKGDIIRTGNESSAVVSSEGYTLYAGRSSSLEVTGNSKKTGILFSLKEGSVISQSSGTIAYSFKCGDYKILPAGTEFMLQFSNDKLAVAVSEGKAVVTGPELRIEISAGMKWSSENPVMVKNLDAETSALINSVSTDIWPADTLSSDEDVKKPVVKDTPAKISESGRVINSNDTGVEKNSSLDDKDEKMEKIKLNRELRDEMNEIKKDQRKEQRREKNGRNKG